MSLPEELPHLDCDKLYKHLIQVRVSAQAKQLQELKEEKVHVTWQKKRLDLIPLRNCWEYLSSDPVLIEIHKIFRY